MIQKIQPCIDKKQKISGKHQRKRQKKILKLNIGSLKIQLLETALNLHAEGWVLVEKS